MWFVLEDKESDKGNSRKIEVEWSTREIIDSSNGRFHHEVTGSSWERYNSGGLWLVVKNDIFCSNYKRNIGRGIGKTV